MRGKKFFWGFFSFWIFLGLFKFGGALHYSLISPLGEKLLPLWLVGLLMGGSAFIQLLFDIPAGHILDRYGYRRFLKITTALFLLAAIPIALGLSLPAYLLSLLLSIFGWLFFGPGVNAYVLSHAPKNAAGKFISLRDVFESIGVVLASAALAFVLVLKPEQMGYIMVVLFSLAFIFLQFSPKDKRKATAEKKISTHHYYIRRHFLHTTLKSIKKLNPASSMLLFLGLAGSIFYGIIWFTIPLVIAHQANAKLLGLGLGIFDFAVVALGFFLGVLADKANRRALVFFGILLFALSGILIGFNFTWVFLLLGFLATTGDEMASISLWSWLHSLDHEHDADGLVSGIITLFQDLGWSIGPIIAGFSYEFLGASWTIVIGATPIILAWIAYQFVLHKQPHRHIGIFALPLAVPRLPHRRRHKS